MTLIADYPTIAIDVPAIDARTPYQKLADAIEAGAKLVRRCEGEYIHYGADSQPIAACALGTAMIGIGVQHEWEMKDRLGLDWTMEVKHPLKEWHCGAGSIIVNLNDTYHWTREQIADWLRTL